MQKKLIKINIFALSLTSNAHVGKKCIMHLCEHAEYACKNILISLNFFFSPLLPMLPSSEKAATSLAETKKKKCLKTFIYIELNEQSSEFN